MTDIVERLRGPHGFQPECYVLRREAADEIERLEEALQRIVQWAEAYPLDMVEKLKAAP